MNRQSRSSRLEQVSGRQMFVVQTRAFMDQSYPEPAYGANGYALPVVHVLPFASPLSGDREDVADGSPALCYSPTWHPEGRTLEACRLDERLYVCPNAVQYHNLRYYEADGTTRWVRDFAEQGSTYGASFNLRCCVIPGSPDQIYAAGDRVRRPLPGSTDDDATESWSLKRYDTNGDVVWRVDLKDYHLTGNAIDCVTDGTDVFCLMQGVVGAGQSILQFDQDGTLVHEGRAFLGSGIGISRLMFAANGHLYGMEGPRVYSTIWPTPFALSMWDSIYATVLGIGNGENGDILIGQNANINGWRLIAFDSSETLKYYDSLDPMLAPGVGCWDVAGDMDGNTYLATAGVYSLDSDRNLRWSAGDGLKTSIILVGDAVYAGGAAAFNSTIEKRSAADGSLIWRHHHAGVTCLRSTTDGVVAAVARSAYDSGRGSFLSETI